MKRLVAPTSFSTSTSVRRRWSARRIVEPTTASTDANTTTASSAAAATPPRINRPRRSVHAWYVSTSSTAGSCFSLPTMSASS